MEKFIEKILSGSSKWLTAVLALGLIVALGLSDLLTTYKLGISFFYLLPILLVSRAFGRNAGFFVSLFCALIWMFVALVTGKYLFLQPALLYWNALTRLIFFVLFVIIFSEWHKEKYAARTDPLTGLVNRMAFDELANMEIKKCRRHGRPVSVVYIDIDDFKTINDRHGHRLGDKLLKTMAQTLSKTMRSTDIVARLGGDEFVVFMPEAGMKQADIALSRLQQAVNFMEKHLWPVTLSIGVVAYKRPPDSLDSMIREADALMYSGKSLGKNRVERRIFDNETEQVLPLRSQEGGR